MTGKYNLWIHFMRKLIIQVLSVLCLNNQNLLQKHVDINLIIAFLYFDKTQNISEENLLHPHRTIPILAFHIQCCSDHLKTTHDMIFVMI